MRKSKLGLIGLCAMVFGVMAFAASAQAEVGSNFLILEANGTLRTGAVLHAAVDGALESNMGSLLTKIAGVSVEFLCTGAKLVGITLQANGTTSSGDVKFTGCTTKLNGVVSPPCEPKDKEGGVGVILTKKGHGLIVLHTLEGGAKDELVLISPDEVEGKVSEIFATIELGAECSIGTKVNVIGPHLLLKDCEGHFLIHQAIHLVEEGPLTELWTISKTAEHKATLDGSATIFLTGIHEGLKWAGDPA